DSHGSPSQDFQLAEALDTGCVEGRQATLPPPSTPLSGRGPGVAPDPMQRFENKKDFSAATERLLSLSLFQLVGRNVGRERNSMNRSMISMHDGGDLDLDSHAHRIDLAAISVVCAGGADNRTPAPPSRFQQ